MGVFLSVNHLHSWWLVAVEAVLAGIGSVYSDRVNLKPNGPFFGILALGACASAPVPVPWYVAFPIAAGAAAFSMAVGFGGWVRGRSWQRGAARDVVALRGAAGRAARFTRPDTRSLWPRRRHRGAQRQRPSALGHGSRGSPPGRSGPPQPGAAGDPPHRGDLPRAGCHRRRACSGAVVAGTVLCRPPGGGPGHPGHRFPVHHRAVHDPALRACDGFLHARHPADDPARGTDRPVRADPGTRRGDLRGRSGGDPGGSGRAATDVQQRVVRHWPVPLLRPARRPGE